MIDYKNTLELEIGKYYKHEYVVGEDSKTNQIIVCADYYTVLGEEVSSIGSAGLILEDTKCRQSISTTGIVPEFGWKEITQEEWEEAKNAERIQ